MHWFWLLLVLGIDRVVGISNIEVTPSLTQTTWATNYVGSLYTVRVSPTTLPVTYIWFVIDTFSFSSSFLSFTSNQCSSSTTITSGDFSASCSGTETTLNAVAGIILSYSVQLFITVDGTQVMATLQTELVPTDCNLQQSFATVLSTSQGSTTACGYNCDIVYQCIPGYTSTSGTFYSASCTESATVQPSNQCFLQTNLASTSSDGLPVWAIILISLGGLVLLAGVIFFIIRSCKRKPVAVAT